MLGIVVMIAWQALLVMQINVNLENLRSESPEARLTGFKALIEMRGGGWEALSNQMLDVEDERSRWLRQGLLIRAASEHELFQSFLTFHQPRFDRQYNDEAWAKKLLAERREKAATNAPVGGFWLGYPEAHIQKLRAGLDDPPSQRQLVLELRRITYQHFGFPWNGPADEQRAALERWIVFLEELQRQEYPEQLEEEVKSTVPTGSE